MELVNKVQDVEARTLNDKDSKMWPRICRLIHKKMNVMSKFHIVLEISDFALYIHYIYSPHYDIRCVETFWQQHIHSQYVVLYSW